LPQADFCFGGNEKAGIRDCNPSASGHGISGDQRSAGEPIEKLLASASVERGQTAASVCLACHAFEKGSPTRVGPNLWNIVDRPRASEPGYNYFAAMKAKGGK
jgi:cytochrome c